MLCCAMLCSAVLPQGSNFYHSLIESFPLFLSLAPILSAHPDIPFLGIFYQVGKPCRK